MAKMGSKVECIWDAQASLGEGPLWSQSRNGIFWVDIIGRRLHFLSLSDGEQKTWRMQEKIGWVVETGDGNLICGLKSGITLFNPVNNESEIMINLEPDFPDNRLNDAKVDKYGRIWAGTMDDREISHTGSLYRIDPDRTWEKVDSGYVVSNGPAFSPEGDILYHTSTMSRQIFAFDLDINGEIKNKRIFITFSDSEGYPDGMACDSEGGLWVAHWGGWRISRFLKDGTLDRVVKMPVEKPTSICFGGAELDQAFITSASVQLEKSNKSEQPLAGGVFSIDLGVTGLQSYSFIG